MFKPIIIILSIIILALIIVIIILSLKDKSTRQVFNKQALHIFEPGTYVNQGSAKPTKLYPSGLITHGESTIRTENFNNIIMTETYQASNPKTKKIDYTREVQYEFIPGPHGAFYMIRRSFSNNQLISIRTGYGIMASDSSIHFTLRGNFHTSGSYYKNKIFSLTKTSNGYHIVIRGKRKIYSEYSLIKKKYY